MKICSKTHQIAPFKTIFRGSMPRTPIANAWLRQASQAPPPKKKKIVGPPWQILHTPMNKMCRKVWKQFETRQGATRHWQNIILPYVLYVLTYSVFLLSQHIYLRIHPGRQLIVCSTLYVYMHYKIFLRGKK